MARRPYRRKQLEQIATYFTFMLTSYRHMLHRTGYSENEGSTFRLARAILRRDGTSLGSEGFRALAAWFDTSSFVDKKYVLTTRTLVLSTQRRANIDDERPAS